MRARAMGAYNTLTVDWTTPAGQWTELRLVRNSYGVPVSQEDGVVMLSQQSGPSVPTAQREAATRSVIDPNLQGGRFQYYAIYLYADTGEWTRAGSCIGLPLLDYGYSNRLWDLTPSVLRTKTSSLLDSDNVELQAFEKVFAYRLDEMRAELETLRDVNDAEKVSGNLLPLMAQQLGIFFEPELGMKQMRTVLRDAVHLYRTKGTIPGVEGFVSALSGYGAKVQPKKNLMLDYNTSSAEESIGSNVPGDNCTVSRYVADNLINAVPDAVVAAAGMRNKGVFRLVSLAAGAAFTFSGGVNAAGLHLRGFGVPVTAGLSYTFSAYARSAAGVQAGVRIWWYDKNGAYITEGTSATGATNDSWVSRPELTMVAPANAVYAGVGMHFVATAANQVVYYDALQFEQGTAATVYQDARLIDIWALAPRVNRITNPNLETNLAGWTYSSGDAQVTGSLVRSTVAPISGTASMVLTKADAGVWCFANTVVDLSELTTYTISFDVVASANMNLRIVDRENTAPSYKTDPLQALVSGVKKRLSYTFTTNAGTTSSTMSIGWEGTEATAGVSVKLDNLLLEAGSSSRTYFDGNTYAFTGESIWETTANSSRSHYYPQRRTKNYRMAALLADYTPMGSSYRLSYAKPL